MDPYLIQKIKNRFRDAFSSEPFIIASPGRINLIGEHVDYNGGLVLPAAIDKGVVVAVQKAASKPAGLCKVIAADLGESFQFDLNDALYPLEKGGWRNYVIGVVAEMQKLGCPLGAFNLVFGGNLPQGAGLSSSAALENGIVFGLNELFGCKLSREQMILVSQRAEQNYAGVQCGLMDQFASMFGEKGRFLFLDCRNMEYTAVNGTMNGYIWVLINSKISHALADSAYNERRALCERTATLLGKKSLRECNLQELQGLKKKGVLAEDAFQKVSYVVKEIERVQLAYKALENKDAQSLGNYLFETHQGLSQAYQVSCPELDFLVDAAAAHKGVVGARMMGGGFGGCTLNLVKEDRMDDFTEQTKEAYQRAFGMKCEPITFRLSEGTHVVSLL
ncbi:galactokinase [Robiginitalea sp. IMCC43444]|uniref:galactokinase n=1 Tax=Robiginitalea sp. IMCC43444 TaxID=3459121 RepID=UPI004042ACFF